MPYRCARCEREVSDELARANQYRCAVRTCDGTLQPHAGSAYVLAPGKLPLPKIAATLDTPGLERHERLAEHLRRIHSLLQQVMYEVDPGFAPADSKTVRSIDRINHLADRFRDVRGVREANTTRNDVDHILEGWQELTPTQRAAKIDQIEVAGTVLVAAVRDLLVHVPPPVRAAVEGAPAWRAPQRTAQIRVDPRSGETVRDHRRGYLLIVGFGVDGPWDTGGHIDAMFSLDGQSLEESDPPVPPRPGHRFKPTPTTVTWDDIEFFQPYGEWPGGTHRLLYRVRVGEWLPPARRGGEPRWNTIAEHAGAPIPVTIEVPVAATIFKVREERDVEQDGRRGLHLHVVFEVTGLAGVPLEIAALFVARDRGAPLPAAGQVTRDVPVPVRRATPFTTALDRDRQLDFSLFVPYEALGLPHGHHSVTYRIEISRRGADASSVVLATRDGEQPLDRDVAPTRALAAVRGEPHEELAREQEGQLGLGIVASFTARNMARWEAALAAFFFDAQGAPLPNLDKDFGTNDGQVAVGRIVRPTSDDDAFDDVRLFIPYAQLHLPPGRHVIRYRLWVRQLNPVKDLVRWDDRTVAVLIPPAGSATLTATERVGEADPESGEASLVIVPSVTLRNLNGWPVRIVARLTDAAGTVINDARGHALTVERTITATSDSYTEPVFSLAVPYSRLGLAPGRQTVGHVVEAWLVEPPRLLGRSVRRTVPFVLPPTAATIGDATFRAMDSRQGNETGLGIRATFRVRGLAGWPCQALVRFWRADGTPIQARTDREGFRLTNGQAAAWIGFEVSTNEAPVTDLELFIPYAMFVPALGAGDHDLLYDVSICQLKERGTLEASKTLFTSTRMSVQIRLTVTTTAAPTARPAIRWVEATLTDISERMDETVDGQLGMIVDVKFAMADTPLRKLECGAYFYAAANDAELKDYDGQYRSLTGQVWTGQVLDLRSGPSRYEAHIFLPYSQLHLAPGTHDLKYVVTLEVPEPETRRQVTRAAARTFRVRRP